MRALIAALSLLIACLLLLDLLAARARWHGLRLTSLRPHWLLASVVGCLALFGALRTSGSQAWIAASLSATLSLPVYIALTGVRHRRYSPASWSEEGVRETFSVQPVAIPAPIAPVTGLLFEPSGTSLGAIVLIHGAGAHKTFYSWPLTEGLLEAGFSVCAIDLDGHGDNRRVLDFPSVLEDVAVTVEWLRERTAWVGVVGVSLGGCVAARAVADGVEVDALALFEAPISVALTRGVQRHEWLTMLQGSTWALHRYGGTWPLANSWRTSPTRSRIGTLDLIKRLDLVNSVARVPCPLWLCYAGNDRIVPLEQARQVAVASPPDTPLVIVRGATHLSLQLDARGIQPLGKWLRSLAERAHAAAPDQR